MAARRPLRPTFRWTTLRGPPCQWTSLRDRFSRRRLSLQLCELSVLDGLPLRPLDLGRLGSTCSALRDLLSHGGSCALWRQAALRTWGEAGAQCSSWSSARADTSSRLDFDSVTAFGSRVGPTDELASLELGSVLPYRVAAAVASLPISSARRRVASQQAVAWPMSPR